MFLLAKSRPVEEGQPGVDLKFAGIGVYNLVPFLLFFNFNSLPMALVWGHSGVFHKWYIIRGVLFLKCFKNLKTGNFFK